MIFQNPDIPNVGTRRSANGFSFPLGDLSNTFLGSLVKGVGNLWDDYVGNTANRENIAYQNEYNEQVFKRADTQYQRTVADLRAAGLSSQLAAGAPSTVAGNTSAPQRSVGNESQAIERLIGMVTSLKQADASSNLANAQADKARAEADAYPALVASQIGSNDASATAARARASYDIALGKIADIESTYVADKAESDIKKAWSEVNRNNKLIDLYEEQISLTSHQSGLTDAQRKEVNQRIENLKQEEKNLKQDFENKVFQGLHVQQQTQNLVIDAAVSYWNLQLSQEFGLRTTDSQTRVSVFGNSVDNVQSILDWNKKMTPLYWITSGDYPWKK